MKHHEVSPNATGGLGRYRLPEGCVCLALGQELGCCHRYSEGFVPLYQNQQHLAEVSPPALPRPTLLRRLTVLKGTDNTRSERPLRS